MKNSVGMDAPGLATLMQGNQALARGALEAGVAWVSGYPGNPSSEVLETLAAVAEPGRLYVEWSANEKVALEAAAAASLAGLRALVTMKQNGVNVALDALTTLSLAGIKGGLVLLTADDPSGISSSNEQDSRLAAWCAHLPLLEPATVQQAKEMMAAAFELSERIGNIVIVRSVSRLSHLRANLTLGPLPTWRRQPRFDRSQVFHGFPIPAKHKQMHDKLKRAAEYFETSGFNAHEGPGEANLAIAACGPATVYAAEAIERLGLAGSVGLAKIGATHPLAPGFIAQALGRARQILVVEENEAVLERALMAHTAARPGEFAVTRFHGRFSGAIPEEGELSPGLVERALIEILGIEPPAEDQEFKALGKKLAAELAPPREFGFCPGCPHRGSLWTIKNALAKDGRDGFVVGDIGCYTMGIWPTGFNQISTVHAMGSGVGLGAGFGKLQELGFEQPVISLAGDSTFFHACLPGLVSSAWNRAGQLLVVLDNGGTAMTGFQPHPGTSTTATGGQARPVEIEKVVRALGVEVTVCDPFDFEATEAALLAALADLSEPRVIVMRRRCALIEAREGAFRYAMRVDPELCRGEECGCGRYCNRVFRCPGLVWDEAQGAAAIDEVICVGCGACAAICPAGAIVREEKP